MSRSSLESGDWIESSRYSINCLHCTVGHDTTIGDFCTLMPGCNISGNVRVGPGTLVGSGAQVLQNLSIGARCKIGSGSVIIHNFEDDLTVVGVPGKAKG